MPKQVTQHGCMCTTERIICTVKASKHLWLQKLSYLLLYPRTSLHYLHYLLGYHSKGCMHSLEQFRVAGLPQYRMYGPAAQGTA